MTVLRGFRAGCAFSGVVTDLLFSGSLPAAQKTWLIIPLGVAAFVTFYLVFRIMITVLNLKTPGREEGDEGSSGGAQATSGVVSSEQETSGVVPSGQATSGVVRDGAVRDVVVEGFKLNAILDGLGGRENIQTLDNCVTRLRVEVNDSSVINDEVLKAAGAKAVVRTGSGSVQVVIGLKVQKVADELRKML